MKEDIKSFRATMQRVFIILFIIVISSFCIWYPISNIIFINMDKPSFIQWVGNGSLLSIGVSLLTGLFVIVF